MDEVMEYKIAANNSVGSNFILKTSNKGVHKA